MKLYRCFTEGDCDLAEINPLILRPDGGVHALDAKVSLDNNAAFRHPEWDEYRATEELDEREQMAREHDLQYIGLDGTVGIIANGAGLAMSTLDVVNQVGGTAANFLDIGGGANADVMAAALEVINFDQKVKSIFINIFGGITRGEEVAKGIVEALGPSRPSCADRDPPRRHERRGGPQDPGQCRHPQVEADVGTHHAGRGSRRRGPRQREQLRWPSSSTQTPRSSCRASPAGRASTTACATRPTARKSSAVSPPARAGKTSRACRCSTPSPRPLPRPVRRRRSSPSRRRPRRRPSSKPPPPASGSSSASPRAFRLRTRPRSSTRSCATSPTPGCSVRTARASSAPASATSASPPARSPSCRPRRARTSASSRDRAR